MNKTQTMVFIFFMGIIAGLILSLWWQTAQREHRRELEIHYEQD